MSLVDVRDFQPEDRTACRQVLNTLGDWFGIAEANEAYINILGRIPTAVAMLEERLVGFAGLEYHYPHSAELHVIAVEPSLHQQGTGTALLSWCEQHCLQSGADWLHVKTRGPLTPDPGYERTRPFYLARGYKPLFETLDLWGPQDSALIMLKPVTPA